jgi:XTP/dITP diphosphohydrolase
MQDLLIATRNTHKTREFRLLLSPVFSPRDLTEIPGLAEIEETGLSFVENALLKALAVSRRFPEVLVLADDSGLEVDALGGAPGIHSARFAGPSSSDAANRTLLLQELKRVGARTAQERSARFRCVLVLARNGAELARSEGIVEGWIAPTGRGHGGFGYDPVFVPEGESRTFAELSAEQKNRFSHRSRAADALLRHWAALGRAANSRRA